MKNRRLRKTLLALAGVLLVASISFGVTLAYLTDAESVFNTFSVGKVEIKLDEGEVYTENTPGATEANLGTFIPNGDRVTKNSYTYIPGRTLDKDPTVWVKEDSEECYIRMKVSISNFSDVLAAFGCDPFGSDKANPKHFYFHQYVNWNSANWWYPGWNGTSGKWPEVADNTATYEYTYSEIHHSADSGADTYKYTYTPVPGDGDYNRLPALFTQFKVPDNLTNAQIDALSKAQITIVAEAIQAAGFENNEAAWKAFKAQHGN